MRVFLVLLLMSCTSTIPNKETLLVNIPDQKEVMEKTIWEDGCFVGSIGALMSQGIKLQQINPIAIVEICHKLTNKRFDDNLSI